jgi:hypothetical protein
MSNFCSYQYVAGPKKGSQCKTFLRGADKQLCFRHKKFGKKDIPESKPIICDEELAQNNLLDQVYEAEDKHSKAKQIEKKPADKPVTPPKVSKAKADVKPAEVTKKEVDKVIQLKLDDSSDSSPDWSTTTESSSYESSVTRIVTNHSLSPSPQAPGICGSCFFPSTMFLLTPPLRGIFPLVELKQAHLCSYPY